MMSFNCKEYDTVPLLCPRIRLWDFTCVHNLQLSTAHIPLRFNGALFISTTMQWFNRLTCNESSISLAHTQVNAQSDYGMLRGKHSRLLRAA